MEDKNTRFIQHESHWEIPISNLVVHRFWVDAALHLLIGTAKTTDNEVARFKLMIETPVELQISDKTIVIDPENKNTLPPMFDLWMTESVKGSIFKNGTIQIEFINSTKILVHPHHSYEAWTLNDLITNNFVVCLPGGGLADFGLLG